MTEIVKSIGALLIGTVTFIIGVFVVGIVSNTGINKFGPASSYVPTAREASAEEIPSLSNELNKLNDLGCWGSESDHRRFGPIRISRDNILTTVCGTLFVRDRQGEVIWKVNIPAPLTDEPKLIDGELVVIGYDLVRRGLDPNTGEQLWASDSNGRAVYAQTETFGKDMYALLTDMSGYESGHTCERAALYECPPTEPDRISLYRRDDMLYDWAVPAGSRIEVKGDRIFASYRRGKRLKRIELKLPKN